MHIKTNPFDALVINLLSLSIPIKEVARATCFKNFQDYQTLSLH